MTYRINEYHAAYGKHSNIPECCIKYFINGWDKDSEYAKVIYDALSDVRYVPCPRCFASKSFIQVRNCITECGKDCYIKYTNQYLKDNENRL